MISQRQQGEVRARSAFVYAALLLGTAVLLLSPGAHRFEAKTSQRQDSATLARGSGATADKAEPAVRARAIESYGKLPLNFEANQGQTDGRVKFLSRGSGYSLFLTRDEAVLALKKPGGSIARDQQPKPAVMSTEPPAVLRMKLVGANARAEVTGVEELPGKGNYFIGNAPTKWRTNVPNYAKVKYGNVYPGIDLVYYGNQGQLEYDFVVQPGADPRQIALDLGAGLVQGRQGVSLRIDGNGDLVVATDDGEVRFHKPVVYQSSTSHELGTKNEEPSTPDKSVIDGHYALKGTIITFEVASYDKTRPLVIDPTLAYSTYLGGSGGGGGGDNGNGVAVDSSGNVYVTGTTGSSNFPVTPGAFQTTCAACSGFNPDAFVSKLNATGSALVYSTYLGGSDNPNYGIALVVDASGNAYVTGLTAASDFPTTPGAFQTIQQSPSDGFVSKLNATGSALVYSTYLGGNNDDAGSAIAVDPSGSAYVTGYTYSTDFPTTPGAFQTSPGLNPVCAPFSCGDAFVSKLNATGSALVYSTYLAGFDFDSGNGIAADVSGNAYVTGVTLSSDFPTTPGSLQPTCCGDFVTKLNPTGSALVYSTYLKEVGGLGNPLFVTSPAIAIDTSANAYVAGRGCCGAVVTKLNADGSALVYSASLAGVLGDQANGIALDSSRNVYVAGFTSSSNFHTTPGAFQTTYGGGTDAFFTKLNSTGSALVYSTYLGGSGADGAGGVAVDAAGNAYVAGSTNSADFPITPGAFQTTYAGTPGGDNAFISKFSIGNAITLTPASLTFAAQAIGTFSPVQLVSLKNTSGGTLNIASISRATNDFYQKNNCPTTLPADASCTLSVMFTPTSGGTKSGFVTISDNAAGSPQKLPLKGTASGTGSIKLTLLPPSINFGDVAVGATSNPQTVTVTNVGSVAANFNAPFGFVKETPGCIWHHNPQCGTSLAPNASCEVTLTFTPRAVGARTGQFVVLQGAHTVYMPLSGTGTP